MFILQNCAIIKTITTNTDSILLSYVFCDLKMNLCVWNTKCIFCKRTSLLKTIVGRLADPKMFLVLFVHSRIFTIDRTTFLIYEKKTDYISSGNRQFCSPWPFCCALRTSWEDFSFHAGIYYEYIRISRYAKLWIKIVCTMVAMAIDADEPFKPIVSVAADELRDTLLRATPSIIFRLPKSSLSSPSSPITLLSPSFNRLLPIKFSSVFSSPSILSSYG